MHVAHLHRPADLRLGYRDRRSCWPGIGAHRSLPVEQYPDIAPPAGQHPRHLSRRVGRDAGEQRHPGDRAAADRHRRAALFLVHVELARARSTITATFDKGTDPDIAQVQVQNKVQQALPRLPQQVQQQGVRGHQVQRRLPDGRRRSMTRPTGAPTSTFPTIWSSNMQDPLGARAGRRRRQRVRLAVRDAHLARSATSWPAFS